MATCECQGDDSCSICYEPTATVAESAVAFAIREATRIERERIANLVKLHAGLYAAAVGGVGAVLQELARRIAEDTL